VGVAFSDASPLAVDGSPQLALLNTPETKRKAVFWALNGHLNIADWRIVLRYEPGNDGG